MVPQVPVPFLPQRQGHGPRKKFKKAHVPMYVTRLGHEKGFALVQPLPFLMRSTTGFSLEEQYRQGCAIRQSYSPLLKAIVFSRCTAWRWK